MLALAAFLACLGVTWALSRRAAGDAERDLREHFEFRVRDAEARLAQRMLAYEQVLRSARGLFAGSGEVRRDEFRRFVSGLELQANFPGIQGVGFSAVVPPGAARAHVEALRREGFPEYAIRPPGARPIYTSIVFLEPFAGRNLRAFGYDMFSEPVRRAAMERARDEASVALSGKVTLLQETDHDVQAGFIMYLPVYREDDPHLSVVDRRRMLVGWVYAPFRAGDLMQGVFGERGSDLDIALYDGVEPSSASRLYGADGGSFAARAGGDALQATRSLEVAGRRWTLTFRATAPFVQWHGSHEARLVAVSGSVASVLVAGLVWLLATGRAALRQTRAAHRETLEAQRALQDSEALVRGIIEAAPEPIFVTGRDGAMLLANPAALNALGRPAGPDPDKPAPAGEVDPALLAQLEENNRLVLASGVAHTFEERVGTPGRERLFLVTKAPHRDASGQVVGVIGVGQDITERNRRELETRRLAAAVDQAPVSVFITDVTGKIEYVNPAFERTCGFSREEAVGVRPNVLFGGVQDPAVFRDMWATIREGAVWAGTVVSRKKTGELLTEAAVVAPVKDAGGVVQNYVAVKRDVSKEVELAEQLAEAQRLETVARLAGGIAHDFNNLLTVILSCAEALRHDLQTTGTASVEDADEIRGAGERARDLTRKLLGFARRQVSQPVPLKVDELVRDAESLLRRLLNEDVALFVNCQAGLWPTRCDPGQLEQVLLNLVVNAGDAMPVGGRLTLETCNVAAGAAEAERFPGVEPGRRFVRLAVEDTGAGMSPEAKARAFEPFFTTKPVGKGTGLGLATVHGIVKQNGGFIRFDSEPGRGTRFEVLLPATDEEPASAARAASGRSGGPETLLLVEDDASVREVTRKALRSGGYTVLTASSGADAIEQLSRHAGPIDLVITDVVMPGMNGRLVADEVRRSWPDVRVLFVSGHADEVLAERGLLDRDVDLVQKPFTPGLLLERVRQALDARQ